MTKLEYERVPGYYWCKWKTAPWEVARWGGPSTDEEVQVDEREWYDTESGEGVGGDSEWADVNETRLLDPDEDPGEIAT